MDYAPTTFWYARPGARWDVKPDTVEAKRAVPRSVESIIKPRKVANALEGETLKVAECTGGNTELQNEPQFGWSSNKQLWWKYAKEQDRLVVEFTIAKAGDYDVTLGITKAGDYGIVRVAVNGQTKIESLDCYNNGVIAVDQKLGTCSLRKGKNTLEVTILGANPDAMKSHMFGLDYILAQKR
jgi:hypothetical protein